jgi:mycothiol synthase
VTHVVEPAVQRRLSPDDVQAVKQLVDAVAAKDGTSPLSDHVMLHLPGGGDAQVFHLLVRGPEGLEAYAHLDVTDAVAGSSAEVVVHPEHRRRGLGRALVTTLLTLSPDGRLRLWARSEHPGAEKLAASLGFVRTRGLWQMRRPLTDPLPDVAVPEGVQVRTFVVGQDEQSWTELNNLAFAKHPDQGGWSVEEVRVREGEPWFDPEGFFLALRGDQMVGFHWTKIHGAHAHTEHQHEAMGEVYAVGVHPSEQGHGLGPALTLLGLHHLQDKGLHEGLLYVDDVNTNAIRVYERLGFRRYAMDICYSI